MGILSEDALMDKIKSIHLETQMVLVGDGILKKGKEWNQEKKHICFK